MKNSFSEAKKIFYDCYGSHFFIDREYGNIYKKYNVPKEIENEWLNDIKNTLSYKIKTSHGSEQHRYVSYICNILSSEESIDLLLSLLRTNTDSFTKLLYCEEAKRLLVTVADDVKYNEIVEMIKEQKSLILSDITNIDADYKTLYYMKDYDFLPDNLIKRVEKL